MSLKSSLDCHFSRSSVHIFDLGKDACTEIFQRTSLKSVSILAQTCKTFHAIVFSKGYLIFKKILKNDLFNILNNYCSKVPKPGDDVPYNIGLNLSQRSQIYKQLHKTQNHATFCNLTEKNVETSASAELNIHVIEELSALPYHMFFSEPDSDICLFMKKWFGRILSIIEFNDDHLNWLILDLIRFRQNFYKDPNRFFHEMSSIKPSLVNQGNFEIKSYLIGGIPKQASLEDKKFLYNYPSQLLSTYTLAEIEELSRRCEAGEFAQDPSSYEDILSETMISLREFIIACCELPNDVGVNPGFLLFNGISLKSLKRFLDYSSDKKLVSHFATNYLFHALTIAQPEDINAVEKLIAFGEYYKNSWHKMDRDEIVKFEDPCLGWLFHTCWLFLVIIQICKIEVDHCPKQDLKIYQFHPLINFEMLLSWIPDPVLFWLKSASDQDLENESIRINISCKNFFSNNFFLENKTYIRVKNSFKILKIIANTISRSNMLNSVLKSCFIHQVWVFNTLLQYGETYKKDGEKMPDQARTFLLVFLLLPSLVLLDDHPADDSQHTTLADLSNEQKLRLKQALCTWIPDDFEHSKFYSYFVSIAKDLVAKTEFPPYFPCSLEKIIVFIKKIQNEMHNAT